MDIFVYGTLRDEGVRNAVLGHAVPVVINATKPGFSQRWVKGATYPMIKPMEGQVAQGVILCGLPESDVARLDAFEGENYERRPSTAIAEDGSTRDVYIYEETAGFEDGGFFDLADWAARLRGDFIAGFMKGRGFDEPEN
ncbi:MAG: gamma-glutamylcyclotransferase [Alphaproteobacteria bacterium]|nr:gamma-glutamylcyclotransferase [Alphaproteobacteria bacterium]